MLRLARRLRAGSPDAPIVLHHDERRSRLDEGALAGLGIDRIRPPMAVEWGAGSQLDLHLRCYAWLLERVAFDWVVLLSGQDYPIRPLADIERDLGAARYDGFVHSEVVAPPPWSRAASGEFARRYFYRYRPIPPPRPRLRRAITAARPLLTLREMPAGTMLGRRVRAPFSAALPCRRGPDWVTLSRRAVVALDGAARARPELVRHYRRTLIPTESFAHTVLGAAPEIRLSADTRRFSVWTPSAHRPGVLGRADLDRILGSGADFARKFDPTVDAAVLDALDARG